MYTNISTACVNLLNVLIYFKKKFKVCEINAYILNKNIHFLYFIPETVILFENSGNSGNKDMQSNLKYQIIIRFLYKPLYFYLTRIFIACMINDVIKCFDLIRLSYAEKIEKCLQYPDKEALQEISQGDNYL